MADAGREQINTLSAQLALAKETINTLARRGAEAASGVRPARYCPPRHPTHLNPHLMS